MADHIENAIADEILVSSGAIVEFMEFDEVLVAAEAPE